MSSTAVSTTGSSAAAVPTIQCAALLYDMPQAGNDTHCGVPYSKEYAGYMTECCNGADVVSYYDNCGLYCLIVDQDVADFKKCLQKGDRVPQQFPFCTPENATEGATGSGKADIKPSVTASVIAGDGVSSSAASGTKTASSAGSSGTSGSGGADDKGAAASFGISKAAVAVGTLLFATFIVA